MKFCNLEKYNSLYSFRNQELSEFPYKYTVFMHFCNKLYPSTIIHQLIFNSFPLILATFQPFVPKFAFQKQERNSLRLEKNRISCLLDATFEILMTRSPLCNYRAANSQAKKITRKFPRY